MRITNTFDQAIIKYYKSKCYLKESLTSQSETTTKETEQKVSDWLKFEQRNIWAICDKGGFQNIEICLKKCLSITIYDP